MYGLPQLFDGEDMEDVERALHTEFKHILVAGMANDMKINFIADELVKAAMQQKPVLSEDVKRLVEAARRMHSPQLRVDTSGSRTRDGRCYCLDCGEYEDDPVGEITHQEHCPYIQLGYALTPFKDK